MHLVNIPERLAGFSADLGSKLALAIEAVTPHHAFRVGGVKAESATLLGNALRQAQDDTLKQISIQVN
ncbi:MAG: hypothetical protein ACPGD8_01290 [Flavobacteriales bacterium]